MQVHDVDDPAVGALRVEVDPGRRVLVAGDRVPEVVVVRVGEDPVDGTTPVGTRDPARLRGSLDGRPLTLAPRAGRLARGSYAVGIGDDRDGAWVLTPATPWSSRLVRGRTRSRRRQLGLLTRGPDGGTGAVWSATLPPTPAEVALGHAVAEAFDTGAELTWLELLLGGGSSLG